MNDSWYFLLFYVTFYSTVAAEALGKAFQTEEEKIESLLKKTMTKKGQEESYKRENEMHKKQKADAEEIRQRAAQAEQKAETAFREAQQEEIENSGTSTALAVFSVVLIPLAPLTIAGAVVAGKKAREARKEKIRQLEAMKEYAEQRKKAYAEIAEFAKKIHTYDAREEMGIGGDAAIDALHKAVGALKSLTVTMLRAADFWNKMQVHCKAISDMKMEGRLANALESGRKARKAVWATPAFKRGAITFFARWVALQCVCATYGQQIKPIQEQLYRSIAENPTFEQSRANIKEIADDLLKELEQANETIANDQAQKDKAIEDLKQADEEDSG